MDALLAGERDALAVRGLAIIGATEADGHDLAAPHRALVERGGMLLVGQLALPLAVGRGVTAVCEEQLVSFPPSAVPHHHDALVAALDGIQHFDADMIE